MSFYKDLNDVKLDLNEFEAIPLSKHEEKRILKKAIRKITVRNRKKKWMALSVGAAVFVLSVTLSMNSGVIASIPFIGETIEKYINVNEPLDYSSYKTAVGETAENKLGKLTLNEVMMDDQQLFLSATFEPSNNVSFDYQTAIIPKVTINGEDYSEWVGAESIELNSEMFTIYNDVTLNQAVETEKVQIEVTYDTLMPDMKRETIEQPWTFDVELSQTELLTQKKEFNMNEDVTLTSGETVTIQKVVTTPISTTVYYDLSQSSSEDIHFNIQSDDGTLETYSFSFTSNDVGDVSFTRFNGFELKEQRYYLVAYDFEGKPLTSSPIPIR